VRDTIKHEISTAVHNPYGFDTAYEISKEHQPFLVTGYFNPDDILDTAIFIKYKSTRKDALFIKHGVYAWQAFLHQGKYPHQ
jgi:hypothetical protein